MSHIPVLLREVLKFLDPKPGETFVDATLGDGGHAIEIIKRLGENGRFLGIDLDSAAIEAAKLKISASGGSALGGKNEKLKIKEVILIQENFANIKKVIQKNGFAPVDGILFDLGIRSEQLEEGGRGFSFLRDEPLDMRFGSPSGETAAEIINSASEDELNNIFRKFGEERFSKDIAKNIVLTRRKERIATTRELVQLILFIFREKLHSKKEVPWIHGGLHPATRVFQALRIAVNHELENLEKVLPDAADSLAPGGRIAVISFHSLEDRIVKHFFKSRKDLHILTKKPIVPTEEEKKLNPRSRSAKLRVAVKLGTRR